MGGKANHSVSFASEDTTCGPEGDVYSANLCGIAHNKAVNNDPELIEKIRQHDSDLGEIQQESWVHMCMWVLCFLVGLIISLGQAGISLALHLLVSLSTYFFGRPLTMPSMHMSGVSSNRRQLLKIKGKLAGAPVLILIDSGSTGNFVSTQFLQQHGIRSESRLGVQPVKMTNGVLVGCKGYISKIKFRMNKYSDTLRDVDVLPELEGCDMILGKPWLTDVNPVIDWKANTVKVSHHGHVHVLHSWQPPSVQQEDDVHLLSYLQLKRAVRKGDPLFLALLRPASAANGIEEASDLDKTPIPAQAQSLLKEFADVFQTPPPGLPPKHAVDHKIELVPGAEPPSRPTYKMSYKELDELKAQLD